MSRAADWCLFCRRRLGRRPNRHDPECQSAHERESGKDRASKQTLAQPGNRRVSLTQDRSTRNEDGDVQSKVGAQSDPVPQSKRNSKRRHEEPSADWSATVTLIGQWIETGGHRCRSGRQTADGYNDGRDPVTYRTRAEQQQPDPTAEERATGRKCCEVEEPVIRPIRCPEVARCLSQEAVSVRHQPANELGSEVQNRRRHPEPEQHNCRPSAYGWT